MIRAAKHIFFRRFWVCAALALACVASGVRADARSEYLIRLLETSSAFRVRAQAALSLSRAAGDPAVVRALANALGDRNAAVRTAAASSLEVLEDPAALPALRAARSDSESAVRGAVDRAIRKLDRIARSQPPTTAPAPGGSVGPARYYIGVGVPGTKVARLDRETLRYAHEFMRNRVREINGVVLAPENENNNQARQVLESRQLVGYYLDSSIVRIENNADGVRAVVSVIVATYPGRDMRAILEGRATVSGGASSSQSQQRQAIESAITGALRRVPQVFASVEEGG